MIRIQFSTSTEWVSGVIRRIIHSPFSHVDALDTAGNCLGASDAPRAPVFEGNCRGVALRPPEYQSFGIRRIAELIAPSAMEDAFWAALRSQLGKPFDGAALHAFLGSDVTGCRNWREERAWFCSELVTWALEQAGFWPFPLLVSKDRVSPADLLLLLNPYVANPAAFLDLPPPPAPTTGEP